MFMYSFSKNVGARSCHRLLYENNQNVPLIQLRLREKCVVISSMFVLTVRSTVDFLIKSLTRLMSQSTWDQIVS